ncbi:sentrin-specific protease 6-like [Acyrthosiphon pisum]|uniref:Ubiquitin-like protease family profile domain-containing protein n=1 Tax=Acyrthosiphon pisum TaxID=7029 RepID=A0A8R2B487_ACYPI|nr:sentrin-specific protease 6-like [Acyrthosiphon pisum]|eukprot:XP_008181075.1 PREDICTED: sentrin-specific protease 6-like [Acyrthosiphon pisum]
MPVILDDKIDGRNCIIRIYDYRMFEKGMLMNDALIEFYLSYMHSKVSDEDKDKAYIFSTHFYSTLTNLGNMSAIDPSVSRAKNRHDKVKKWTKNLDVFKKDFIFVPVNKYKHWFLEVICFPYLSGKVNIQNGIPSNEPDNDTGRYKVPRLPRILDSMKLIRMPCILIFDSYSRGTQSAVVSATLREWLQHEYCNKYNGQQKDLKFMKVCPVKVPQQPNNTDCGLFVMHYFEMFYSRPIIDYTFPIHHLENWFHTDDVVKNEKKRKEVYNILKERIEKNGLPDGIELPVLHFNDHIEESGDIRNMNNLFEKVDKQEEKEEKDEYDEEEEEQQQQEKYNDQKYTFELDFGNEDNCSSSSTSSDNVEEEDFDEKLRYNIRIW